MQVKCGLCGTKQEKSEMYCDAGKQKKYYHHSCWTMELERRDFAEKEKTGWNNLYGYVHRLYNFHAPIPPQFVHVLQDLRNGTVRYKGPVIKGNKDGVPYEVILSAYRLAEQKIIQSKAKTDTFDNDFLRLKYGFSIMLSYLNQAYTQHQRQIEAGKRMAAVIPVEVVEVEYKKKKHGRDISAFLEE